MRSASLQKGCAFTTATNPKVRSPAECIADPSSGTLPRSRTASREIRTRRTAPFDKSVYRYIQYDISAVRATQKLYRTSLDSRDSRERNTVSFADRVSHPVDSPRPFLHVLRASGSARNGQSPEQSNRPRMHWIQN